MIFNIRRRESTRHLLYFCNSMSASFIIDQLQMGMLLGHRYNPNHLVSTCCKMLSRDNLSNAVFNKYNVPYNRLIYVCYFMIVFIFQLLLISA